MEINKDAKTNSNSITQKILDWKAMVKASEVLSSKA